MLVLLHGMEASGWQVVLEEQHIPIMVLNG